MNTVTENRPAVSRSEAGIAAVNCVALTYVVVSAAPFQCATEALLKLVPVNVRLKPAAPTAADVCDSDVSVGDGLLIGRVSELEIPPPGGGLAMNTITEPDVAMSEAGTTAVNCVALTNVVASGVALFHITKELPRKLFPFTVSV